MVVLAFVLGLLMALVAVAVWWFSRQLSSPAGVTYRARAAIRDIERQTIHSILMAERAARRAESIEGRVRRS